MSDEIFGVVKILYKTIIRPWLIKKVEASPSPVDDFIVKIIDKVLDYNGN